MIPEKFGNITLINADCMAVLNSFKDGEYDLAIVDVPYGIGEDGAKNHTRKHLTEAKNYESYSGEDKEPPNEDYWRELFRVSKNQIIWGANHFISKFPVNVDSSCWIVWDKNNGGSDFADCELAWTSFDTAVRKFKWTWNGMLQENMKNKQIRIHPNEKPIELYKWLLSKYAKRGDKIIDTHSGSLSIGIACHDLEFTLTAIEKHTGYYEKAKRRLQWHQKQLMFKF